MQCRSTAWIAVGLAGALGPAADAGMSDIDSFTDRELFESAAGSMLIRESFEDEPLGELSLPYTLAGSGIDVAIVAPVGADYVASITESSIFSQPSDGVRHLSFAFGQGSYAPSFRMPDLSLAFGLDLSGYQDFDESETIDLELWRAGDLVATAVLPAPPGFGPGFLGVISGTPFDEVRLLVEDGGLVGFGDFVGVDQLTVGIVPGPGAAGLLALAALAHRGRRRR